MNELRTWTTAIVLGAALLALVAAAVQPGGAWQGATGSPPASPAVCATPEASPGASPVSLEGSGMVATTHVVTIELTDQGFTPNYVQTTTGHDLWITLINTGTRDHAFVVDRYDVRELLAPGEETLVVIRRPEEITVEYYSDAPCDEGMTGELTFYI